MLAKQIDCFKINMKFWTIIGIWPGSWNPRFYKYYSRVIIGTFIIIYNLLFTINFYFVDKNLDSVVQEMIFYFTEVACTSKCFTFLIMHDEIVKMLSILESNIFQPVSQNGINIICNAKKLNIKYWKFITGTSVSCNIAHVIIPVIAHIFLSANLDLPVTSYSFLSDSFREKYNYLLYFYQSVGIHVVMWFNINIDTFILGVMILIIAQLDIIDEKLRNITDENKSSEELVNLSNEEKEIQFMSYFNECIIHYDEVGKFVSLFQRIFSITLFMQFSMSSYIICVCLFRFTLPAPFQYRIFLATYMTCMIFQVMAPCWFGTQIIVKSILPRPYLFLNALLQPEKEYGA
ncbi:7tm odorant receptor domain-containing protein [Phthorimaea operculella]|nr:7tm odorant receptor domain-containing protein [Phthorimaea operculella]